MSDLWLIKREMFWEWFFDLWEVSFGAKQPCPSCDFRVASDCGYSRRVQDYWSGGWEHECDAPEKYDEEGEKIYLECEGCHYLICDDCKNKLEATE